MQHPKHRAKASWATAACLAPALALAQATANPAAKEPPGWSYHLSGSASMCTGIATSSVAPTPPANGGSLNGNLWYDDSLLHHGVPHGNNFVQGRKIWVLGLDAEWDNKVYASLSYLVNRGVTSSPARGWTPPLWWWA